MTIAKPAMGLLQEMRELIDMLPDDMVELAAEYILEVPEYPEDYRKDETAILELAKDEFRRGVGVPTSNGGASLGAMRAGLHRLAESMSDPLLDEAVYALGSTALLNIPYEPTEEEWESIRAGMKEAESGDVVPWEQIRRADV